MPPSPDAKADDSARNQSIAPSVDWASLAFALEHSWWRSLSSSERCRAFASCTLSGAGGSAAHLVLFVHGGATSAAEGVAGSPSMCCCTACGCLPRHDAPGSTVWPQSRSSLPSFTPSSSFAPSRSMATAAALRCFAAAFFWPLLFAAGTSVAGVRLTQHCPAPIVEGPASVEGCALHDGNAGLPAACLACEPVGLRPATLRLSRPVPLAATTAHPSAAAAAGCTCCGGAGHAAAVWTEGCESAECA
mmetsp:Transcript_14979/g.34308  ORF Transcript_14979/g.34308 Transcript_14979/m.34308 type:complete len:247 (+) Transcript_14979:681-1421(+)